MAGRDLETALGTATTKLGAGLATDPLAHIPGGQGPPLIGHTLSFLRDARRLLNAKQAEHGDVFQTRVLGRRDVVFLTPEATRQIYLDPDKVLSSEQGWSTSIGPMFRNGLMLRDFTDHHLHRRVMQQAFRRTALEGYVAAIHRVIDRHVDELGPGPVDIYRFMKRLTLDIAADVFVGASLGAQAKAVGDSTPSSANWSRNDAVVPSPPICCPG